VLNVAEEGVKVVGDAVKDVGNKVADFFGSIF
jgi:hypothetical protein